MLKILKIRKNSVYRTFTGKIRLKVPMMRSFLSLNFSRIQILFNMLHNSSRLKKSLTRLQLITVLTLRNPKKVKAICNWIERIKACSSELRFREHNKTTLLIRIIREIRSLYLLGVDIINWKMYLKPNEKHKLSTFNYFNLSFL